MWVALKMVVKIDYGPVDELKILQRFESFLSYVYLGIDSFKSHKMQLIIDFIGLDY